MRTRVCVCVCVCVCLSGSMREKVPLEDQPFSKTWEDLGFFTRDQWWNNKRHRLLQLTVLTKTSVLPGS